MQLIQPRRDMMQTAKHPGQVDSSHYCEVIADITVCGLEDEVVHGTEYPFVHSDAPILKRNDNPIHSLLCTSLKQVSLKVIRRNEMLQGSGYVNRHLARYLFRLRIVEGFEKSLPRSFLHNV